MSTHFDVDSTHSSLEFDVQHLGISTFRGRFGAVKGALELNDGIAGSSLTASIEAKSFITGNTRLLDAMVGADFFQADQHPNLEFKSTGFTRVDDKHWKVAGQLSIRGVAKPIELSVEDRGTQVNPFFSKAVKSVRATATIDRTQWGIVWNVPLDNGGKYLGEQVKLDLNVELIQG